VLLILLGVLVVHGAEGASTHAGSLPGTATAAAQTDRDHRMQLVASTGNAADLAASVAADTEPDHGSEHSQDLGCFAVVAPTSAPDVDAATPSLTTPAGTERDSYTGPSPSGPGSRPPPCRALSLFELSVLRV
jgi:hypothetical protein